MTADEAAAANHANRWPITICIMAATTMVVLDQTIANVALPHMQGSLSASQDQITWVLTSYIVASALALPMSGWLTERIGARTLLLGAVATFTVSSFLCGIAQNLPEIVIFRILQGASGAPLMPLSQAIVFDVHPPEKRAQSMTIWGLGTMAAPMLGPLVGGYLTENLSWNWVFFVNIPIGVACFVGLSTFLSQSTDTKKRPFDGMGYAFIICFIGGLQLMVDRGQTAGWFDSAEIWIYAAVAGFGLYFFIVHAMFAKNPFFHTRVLTNPALLTTAALGSVITAAMMSSTALQPLMVQGLLGYSVIQAGIVATPRGIGLLISMQAASFLLPKFGARVLMLAGMTITGISLIMMSAFSLQMDSTPLIITGFIQGLGGPLVFMPISMMALNSLAPDVRTEGATLFNLFRNLGSSLGIAIVGAIQVRDAGAARAHLVENLRPDNPNLAAAMPQAFQTQEGIAQLNAMATQQAAMVSYVSVFGLLGWVCLLCLPLVFFLKAPAMAPVSQKHEPAELMTE